MNSEKKMTEIITESKNSANNSNYFCRVESSEHEYFMLYVQYEIYNGSFWSNFIMSQICKQNQVAEIIGELNQNASLHNQKDSSLYHIFPQVQTRILQYIWLL